MRNEIIFLIHCAEAEELHDSYQDDKAVPTVYTVSLSPLLNSVVR